MTNLVNIKQKDIYVISDTSTFADEIIDICKTGGNTIVELIKHQHQAANQYYRYL